MLYENNGGHGHDHGAALNVVVFGVVMLKVNPIVFW